MKSRKRKRSAAALAKELESARAAALPGFVEPQLATLVESASADDTWVHEIKYDGYRTQVRLEGGRVRWFSRRGHDWSTRFAALSPAVAALPAKAALIDGESVVLDKKGVSHFQNLQKALGDEDDGAMTYFAFDLLHLDGLDLRRCALTDRKDVLRELLAAVPASAPLRYSEHMVGGGDEFHAQACRRKLEGIISKRADGGYVSGRTRDWLKVKCGLRQEFVIAGFTQPQGSRTGFGALVLGVHERGKLRHAGRVGTGFDRKLLRELRKRLDALAIDAPPFEEALDSSARRGVTWVRPRLVADVTFTGWTGEGLLRHPSFQGLREDKSADEVVVETPKPRRRGSTPPRSARSSAKKQPMAKKTAKRRRSGKGRS
jgi:bifunctional non-homologous end joining protein LigD